MSAISVLKAKILGDFHLCLLASLMQTELAIRQYRVVFWLREYVISFLCHKQSAATSVLVNRIIDT
jgi:hypothetical protein